MSKRRVGILGYGALGKYLVEHILTDPVVSSEFELAFVWNRTVDVITQDPSIPRATILENIQDFEKFKPQLVVEVAHPNITKEFAPMFLEAGCDFFCGSPTVFAETTVEEQFRAIINKRTTNGIYLPVGALWGAEDIKRMASRGTLCGLKITMKFHPHSLKLTGDLSKRLEELKGVQGEHILYSGPVRGLCGSAPNNTNTMACAALAGFTLGFDKTQGCLICDESLTAHIIDIEVEGPTREAGTFRVHSTRFNPAATGAVTGSATFVTFLQSMMDAHGKLAGFHFC